MNILACIAAFGLCWSSEATPDRTVEIKSLRDRIIRADYEADLEGLDRLYDEGSRYLDDEANASRTRYWRAYAKWRKAINGFNLTPTPNWLVDAARAGLDEFRASLAVDQTYVESKVGAVGCIGLTYFLLGPSASDEVHKKDMGELASLAQEYARAIRRDDPDNPRWSWLWAQQLSIMPTDKGGGRDAAVALCIKALEVCDKRKPDPVRPLDPTWGKPELHMNLAYYYLNLAPTDYPKAKGHALQALRAVPNWHYMKDILMPQIEAKIRAKGG